MPNAPDLHVHSTFSMYDGFGSPKAVVARAKELGWGAVALTEHGHLMSAPVLYQEAKKVGIKPILGCEMYVTPEPDLHDGDKTVLSQNRHLTVLALSLEGYKNLVAWVSASYKRPNYYSGPRISIDRMIEIAPYPLHHNVVLSGCLGGELCQCLLHANGNSLYAAESWVGSMAVAFPNFYIELQNHAMDKFRNIGLANYEGLIASQAAIRDMLIALADKFDVPMVVTNDSHYQDSKQRKAHLAMMARKQANGVKGEAATFGSQYGYWTNYMRPMEKIAATLPGDVGKEAIQSIHDIVEETDVRFDPLDKFSYSVPRSGYDDPVAEIRRRSKARLKSVVARHGKGAEERFSYELETMAEFADYLCLVSDIVRMARDAGIYSWTRGSAANSLVCFCLRIHDIDPIHYKLIFERFVNPARTKLPDIDIDFEGHRRDDVAKMLVEHMAEREPMGGVRGVCTYSTVNNRAAFRLMAESAGIPKERIDNLTKLIPSMIDSGMASDEEEAYELVKDEYPDLYALVSEVFDSIGNISQHACAFALGTDERPLDEWVPQYLIGSSNAEVTQFNMKAIEEMGFLKMDLLKLDSLTIMHNIARMVGRDMKWLDSIMATAPGIYDLADEDTFDLLRAGRTEGVHSFQGGTQRRGCIEVAPESDHDMVAIQALYRPSGTRTGYDKQFVNRKHQREDWHCINGIHAKYTEETFGFPIFQEQIMEMAFGLGMTGAEVDDLYKAIKTAKGVGRGAAELFEAFEPTFRKYASEQMPEAEADQLWAQWDAMQGYTFNRGHASSYAILGMKMAYLKAHYPQEFFIALLDRYPNNPRYLAAAIAEGFTFEPPDVNASGGSYSRGTHDKAIRIGLQRIDGIGPATVQAIVRNQPFGSIEDMVDRCGGRAIKQGEKINTVDILRSVGALESIGIAGDEDDLTDFRLLDFVPRRPKVFKGCRPTYLPRGSEKWKFLGLNRGVTITQGKAFCAKLFWLPPVDDNFVTKTSASGKYDAHLLTVIDENGIPFDLSCSTDKEHASKLIKLLNRRANGAVICAEGQVAMPFLRGGRTQFKLWDIVGAQDEKPQLWHCDDELVFKGSIHLAQEKRRR